MQIVMKYYGIKLILIIRNGKQYKRPKVTGLIWNSE